MKIEVELKFSVDVADDDTNAERTIRHGLTNAVLGACGSLPKDFKLGIKTGGGINLAKLGVTAEEWNAAFEKGTK